jgi:hypothetical protein
MSERPPPSISPAAPAAAPGLEAAVDAAIAICDGDPRATVRALILANAYLEDALGRLQASVSRGYVRGSPDREGRGPVRSGAARR